MSEKNLGIICLNDCNLSLTVGQQSWYSSGFATLTNNSADSLFGEQAQQQARLQPLVSFNQFWNQLSLDPIHNGSAKFRHYADFAYHQLLELHQQAPDCHEVIFCIPASFSREQLSLLLGICQQCPFKIVGLVDSAVAAVADAATPGTHLYLDMQLHQCLISQISVDDSGIDNNGIENKVRLHNADIIAGTGLINLYQHWAKYLAGQFIQQCRFDPLHNAATEQQLYDILPQLHGVNATDDEVQLTLQGKQAKLNRQSLMRHGLDLFEPVLKAIEHLNLSNKLYISERVAAIPELSSRLSDTLTIADSATIQNTLNFKQHIIGDKQQVSFTTALPANPAHKITEKQSPDNRFTHLLLQNHAYPVGQKAIYIRLEDNVKLSTEPQAKIQAQFALIPQNNGPQNNGPQNNGSQKDELLLTHLNGSELFINGRKSQNGDVLSTGDCLSFSKCDESLTLINVVEDTNW